MLHRAVLLPLGPVLEELQLCEPRQGYRAWEEMHALTGSFLCIECTAAGWTLDTSIQRMQCCNVTLPPETRLRHLGVSNIHYNSVLLCLRLLYAEV